MKLVFGTIVVILALLAIKTTVNAQTETQSLGLTATVDSNPPTTGATITTPNSGQSVSDSNISVAGNCPNQLEVRLYRNDVFAGSAICQNGQFDMRISLFFGQNDLVARVFDNLNQEGPVSNTVVVSLTNQQNPKSITNITLTSIYSKRGALRTEPLSWPINISGATSPYALSVDWGDSSEPDVYSVASAGDVTIKHTYKISGNFRVTIKATDSEQRVAYLQLIGFSTTETTSTLPVASTQSDNVSEVITVDQPDEIFGLRVAVVFGILSLLPAILSFWLGGRAKERHIKRRLRSGNYTNF